jgi:hypothetical protein
MQTRKDDNIIPVYVNDDGQEFLCDGLSKRECFAAIAMIGFLIQNKYVAHCIPTKAVEMADELIKQLNEQP